MVFPRGGFMYYPECCICNPWIGEHPVCNNCKTMIEYYDLPSGLNALHLSGHMLRRAYMRVLKELLPNTIDRNIHLFILDMSGLACGRLNWRRLHEKSKGDTDAKAAEKRRCGCIIL